MSTSDQPFVGQEIHVPSSLPMILKQFCKAAIRTQPYDLLKWASSYFRALADGEEPPTKLRLEYSPPSTSGLTLGFLRVLLRQFGDYNKSLSVETILYRWNCLCLDRKDLNLIMMIGRFRRKCQVKKFLAIAVGLLGSSLFETMIMICELFTHEPEGGSAMIPVTLFMEIYGYLAGLRCDGSKRDSSDDDPTEFIICEETKNIESLEVDTPSEGKISIDRVCSVTSQDTEADVNLDLESLSKEDSDSSKNDVIPQIIENYTTQEMAEDKTGNGSLRSQSLKDEDNNDTPNSQIESNKEAQISDETNSNKSEHSGKHMSNNSDDNLHKDQKGSNTKPLPSCKSKRKKIITDTKLVKYYPNIPGIGPRLTAEEVASIAIWMSECARIQEGMVGPRNLRHMDCPPLDRQQFSES